MPSGLVGPNTISPGYPVTRAIRCARSAMLISVPVALRSSGESHRGHCSGSTRRAGHGSRKSRCGERLQLVQMCGCGNFVWH